MAINFIKNIHDKNVDRYTHHTFTRYSLGQFAKEPFTIAVRKIVKMQGGFEYVNTFVRFFAQIATGNVTVNGAIPTIQDVEDKITNSGLEVELGRRYGKKGKLYKVTGSISVEKLRSLIKELGDCYLLLDLETEDAKLKVKKKETPKIGSPAAKYVTLTIEKDHLGQIIQEFLFDVKEESFKNVEILHTYHVDTIDMDKKLAAEDPLAARLAAVRNGKIERVVTIDGEVHKSEFPLKA